jgi:hypothetical protein
LWISAKLRFRKDILCAPPGFVRINCVYCADCHPPLPVSNAVLNDPRAFAPSPDPNSEAGEGLVKDDLFRFPIREGEAVNVRSCKPH